jgi:uncharacterized protein YgfB (UPF0149 family)
MGKIFEPGFDAVNDALRCIAATAEPAEIHGEYCGLACLLGADAGPAWVAQIKAEGNDPVTTEAATESVRVIEELADRSFAMLNGGDMEFTPLLPGDDEPLEVRAESLGQWCQAFMRGLGSGGPAGQSNRLLEEGVIAEVIKDFSEITRASFGQDETEDEAEAAYIEVVEYVRVSVQLIFEEMYGLRESSTGEGLH